MTDYQAAIFDILERSSAPTGLYFDLVAGSRPDGECATLMGAFNEEANDLVERVAALEPPSDVAGIQDDFVAAARQSVGRVGEITDEVAAGEVRCGQPLNDLLYGMPSSNEAEKAIGELEKHGYVVGGE